VGENPRNNKAVLVKECLILPDRVNYMRLLCYLGAFIKWTKQIVGSLKTLAEYDKKV